MATEKKVIKKKSTAQRSTIHVGDLVQIKFSGEEMKGRVVENRGHIGVGGQNLYRILLHMDVGDPMNIELPADRIRISHRAKPSKKLGSPGRGIGPKRPRGKS